MMKKLIATGFAALAVVAVSGCSSDSTPASTTPVTSSTETFAIDSWTTFGKAGVQWFDECATLDFGCYDSQVASLLTSAADLPKDSMHSTRSMELYREIYAKYVAQDCATATTSKCSMYTTQLGTLRDGLQTGLERMSTGG